MNSVVKLQALLQLVANCKSIKMINLQSPTVDINLNHVV